MKKSKAITFAVVALIAILSIYLAYSLSNGSIRFFAVLSGSMMPMMNPGDVAIVSGVNPADVKVGDVITFRSEKNFVTHRVVDIVLEDYIKFRTKGDAVKDADQGLVNGRNVVGKVAFVIPKAGYLGNFVRSPIGYFLFILLPGILIIIFEVKKIINSGKKGEKKKTRRGLSSALILFSLILFASAQASAFFSDEEISGKNIQSAGTLYFSLNSPGDFSGKPATRDIDIISEGSLDFQYNATVRNISGDNDFCKGLQLEAELEGTIIYSGSLMDFGFSPVKISGKEDNWHFTISMPEGNNCDDNDKGCDDDHDHDDNGHNGDNNECDDNHEHDDENHSHDHHDNECDDDKDHNHDDHDNECDDESQKKTCRFSFVFTGWQTNMNDPYHGFSDTREIGNTVTSNGCSTTTTTTTTTTSTTTSSTTTSTTEATTTTTTIPSTTTTEPVTTTISTTSTSSSTAITTTSSTSSTAESTTSTTEPTIVTTTSTSSTTSSTTTSTSSTITSSSTTTTSTTSTTTTRPKNKIVINEVYYDAADISKSKYVSLIRNNGDKGEWIELYNPGSESINLKNWQICNHDECKIIHSNKNIPAYGFALLSHDESTWLYWDVPESTVIINLGGSMAWLNNDGDQLALKNAADNYMDFVAWEKGYKNSYPEWNITAKKGESIARKIKGFDTDSVNDWKVLTVPTPGS